MKRRDFFKMGLLSIASFYLFPEMLFQFDGKKLLDFAQLEKHELNLVGKYYEEIKDGKVLLPEPFISSLISKRVRLLAANNGHLGYLRLIPGDNSVKEKMEKEIKEFSTIESEIKISYLGTTRLSKKGHLFIPWRIRKLVGLTNTGDVIIFGMIDSVEIWDKNSWSDEIEKYLKIDRETIERCLAKYSL